MDTKQAHPICIAVIKLAPLVDDKLTTHFPFRFNENHVISVTRTI